MKGILADANIEGHWKVLFSRLYSDTWREVWLSLNLQGEPCARLGLAAQAPDRVIWHTCQQPHIVLLTNNRNQDRPDSLEAVIRAHNTPASLPVFTLASADRVLTRRDYAERVTEQLLRYL